jgi:phosphoribosylformylglycinamidine cyclo-ligase
VSLEDPVLVSGTDGVGTKLKLAFQLGVHDTIGIDCVAMCVNDIVTSGARPLFFLDYLATGRLDPAQAEGVVRGIAEGCRRAGCALIGGETAEMPGFYADGEYDVAGFTVGVVDRAAMLTREKIAEGDAIVGISSSGFHSNGFSLVRKVVSDAGLDLESSPEVLGGHTLGEALLAPTEIYVKPALRLVEKVDLHGLAHITGGGFYENVPRVLPVGLGARFNPDAWDVPPVIRLIQNAGSISEREMYHVFNMGIGMMAFLPDDRADEAVEALENMGLRAWTIGRVEGSSIAIDGVD